MQLKSVFWRACLDYYDQFFALKIPRLAASLAYTTLLSLVPLLIVGFYILSFFPLLQQSVAHLEQLGLKYFVAGYAGVLGKQLSVFIAQVSVLSAEKIIFLAFSALLLMYNLATAFNHIWQQEAKHHVALEFLIYLLVLVCSPVMIAVALLLGPHLHNGIAWAVPGMHIGLSVFWSQVFPFLLVWLVFSLFNWVLPYCRVLLRWAFLSGLVTMILFEAAKWGFAWYVGHVSTYRLIYGALAVIPLFLIWLYVSWLIILGGTLLCAGLQHRENRLKID